MEQKFINYSNSSLILSGIFGMFEKILNTIDIAEISNKINLFIDEYLEELDKDFNEDMEEECIEENKEEIIVEDEKEESEEDIVKIDKDFLENIIDETEWINMEFEK